MCDEETNIDYKILQSDSEFKVGAQFPSNYKITAVFESARHSRLNQAIEEIEKKICLYLQIIEFLDDSFQLNSSKITEYILNNLGKKDQPMDIDHNNQKENIPDNVIHSKVEKNMHLLAIKSKKDANPKNKKLKIETKIDTKPKIQTNNFSFKHKNTVEIERVRCLSYPYQENLAPGSTYYVYTCRFPIPSLIEKSNGIPENSFTYTHYCPCFIFNKPITKSDFVCRFPLYQKTAMHRVIFKQVQVKQKVELESSQIEMLETIHEVISNCLFNWNFFGEVFTREMIGSNTKMIKDLLMNPNESRINCLISFYNLETQELYWEMIEDLMKWHESRSVTLDCNYSSEMVNLSPTGILTKSDIRLNQLKEEDWKGRMVKPTNSNPSDLGVFVCTDIQNDLNALTKHPKASFDESYHQFLYSKMISKCNLDPLDPPIGEAKRPFPKITRISRNRGASNSSYGHTDREAKLESLDMPAYLIQVHPIPAWIAYQLFMVPHILQNLEKCLYIDTFNTHLQVAMYPEVHGKHVLDTSFSQFDGIPNGQVKVQDRLNFCKSRLYFNELPKARKNKLVDLNREEENITVGYTKADYEINQELIKNGSKYYREENVQESQIMNGCLDKLTIETGHLMTAVSLTNVDTMFNLESLEWLGDSVINFAYTIDTIANNPDFTEEHLTRLSHQKVSNQNLFNKGIKKGIFNLILTNKYTLDKSYLPPKYAPSDMSIMEKKKDERFFKIVSNKAISDCVESIAGVFLYFMGAIGAFRILRYFGIIRYQEEAALSPSKLNIYSDNTNLKLQVNDKYRINFEKDKSWINLITEYMDKKFKISKISTTFELIPDYRENCDAIEKIFHYKFKNRNNLLQALCHKSSKDSSNFGNYEVLEYFGDAILRFAAAQIIYTKLKLLSPGQLSCLRSHVVSNVHLAYISVKNGISDHVIVDKECKQRIDNFIDECGKIQFDIETMSQAGSSDLKSKILADIMEAIIGAIYIDSDCNHDLILKIIWYFIAPTFESFISKIPMNRTRMFVHQYPNLEIKEESKPGENDGTFLYAILPDGVKVCAHGTNYTQARVCLINKILDRKNKN